MFQVKGKMQLRGNLEKARKKRDGVGRRRKATLLKEYKSYPFTNQLTMSKKQIHWKV